MYVEGKHTRDMLLPNEILHLACTVSMQTVHSGPGTHDQIQMSAYKWQLNKKKEISKKNFGSFVGWVKQI